MTMPITTNRQKLGPINVVEDNNHFLVHIHPENRDRAKKIAGRQWDGERRAWVYPKDLNTYNALVEEFKRDADTFDIIRPEIKQTTKPPITTTYDEGYDDEIIEIANVELTQIREMLVALNESSVMQNQTMEQLCDHQIQIAKCLSKLEPPTMAAIKTEKIEILPEALNLDTPKERLLIEKVLVQIAYETAQKSTSFSKWLEGHRPLEDSASFVQTIHEKLKQQLEKIAGEANSDIHFNDLIRKIEEENLVFIQRNDPSRFYQILHTLNRIRNRFSHPRGAFHRCERWVMSILYLMNLALIWPKIKMEAEEEVR